MVKFHSGHDVLGRVSIQNRTQASKLQKLTPKKSNRGTLKNPYAISYICVLFLTSSISVFVAAAFISYILC